MMNSPEFLQQSRPVIIAAGPTASGKSALALDVAREFGGTVINADSMQIYAELNVLTARPSASDEAAAPHRLYGVMSAAQTCSAGHWVDLAVTEIKSSWRAGRLPIVTGGTGLYIKTLMEGISILPDVPADVRNRAQALWTELGGDGFHAEVATRDPVTAARLPHNDQQRLVRAYGVFEATGRPLSDWQRESTPVPPITARFLPFVLMPARQDLYASCDRRFDIMLEMGALDEVRALMALGLGPDRPAMKALGVPELCAYLNGDLDLVTARLRAKQLTRNFAKRQCTWFNNQLGGAQRLSTQYSESMRPKIFSFIRQFVLTDHP